MNSIKRKRIKSILLMICLIVTCICFDTVRADDFEDSFGATGTNNIVNSDLAFLNEDMCTFEMLGNNNSSLIWHNTIARKTEILKKTELVPVFYVANESNRSFFRCLTSESLNSHDECTDAAGIIKFIQDKDGKKTI